MASSSGTRAGNLCASSKKKTGIFFAGALGLESSFPFEAGFEEDVDVDGDVFEGWDPVSDLSMGFTVLSVGSGFSWASWGDCGFCWKGSKFQYCNRALCD